MIQEIIVLILLMLAAAYIAYRAKRKFFNSTNTCDSCAFSEKKEIEKN
ncbi:MAG: hypothetical protein NT109_10810 [Flavobacteriia bacterium]|nr:hypothetical protein [Flavobacteriia bacterium]